MAVFNPTGPIDISGGPNIYRAPTPTTTAPPTTPATTTMAQGTNQSTGSGAPDQLRQRIQGALGAAGSTDDPNYWYDRISADPNGSGSAWDYWVGRINQGDGALGVRNGTVQKFNDTPGGGGGGYGTGVFDDPASQQWEQLLNQRIQQLQTPFSNPGFQPAIDQMQGYLKQLNGPVYTPQQADLLQTQALDPLAHQRSQNQEQIMARMSARGISPTSGIAESALEANNNNFDRLQTQEQSGFAANAVALQQEHARQAAQLAPLIAQMYQQQFNGQDQRNAQAVDLAKVIPDTAWSRLTGAGGAIQNPNASAGLLQQLTNAQNTGYGQDSAYMSSLLQALGGMFG